MSDTRHPAPPREYDLTYADYLSKPGSWQLPIPMRSTFYILPGIGIQGGRVVKQGTPGWRKAVGAPPAQEPGSRKTVACGQCGGAGHNKRSCKEGK